MKRLIVLLLFISQIVIANAQETRFKEGETLNVWANSGLNMRDKPDAKATKIATLPFGSKVVVQPQIGVKIPHEVEEFKGFVVKGVWLLVKAGNTEGWVFDGFLSRLPAPMKGDKSDIEVYFENKIGSNSEKFDTWVYSGINHEVRQSLKNEKVERDKIQRYKQNFKHGLSYSFRSGEGMEYGFSSSEINYYEAYILVKTYFFNAESDYFRFEKSEKAIVATQIISSYGCSSEIKMVGKKVVVSIGCGC